MIGHSCSCPAAGGEQRQTAEHFCRTGLWPRTQTDINCSSVWRSCCLSVVDRSLAVPALNTYSSTTDWHTHTHRHKLDLATVIHLRSSLNKSGLSPLSPEEQLIYWLDLRDSIETNENSWSSDSDSDSWYNTSLTAAKKLLCWSRTLILKGSSCDETQRPLQTVAEEDEGAEGRGVNIDHHFINYSNGKFRARRAGEGEQEGGAETSIFGFARNLS